MYQGAIDRVDERNYSYSEIAGDIGDIKDFVINNDNITQDQNKGGHPYGCVYYATSMMDNYLNLIDKMKERSTGGEIINQSNTFIPNFGDDVVNGPKTALKMELIKGFWQVRTIAEVKKVLNDGLQILTGSNLINWSLTEKGLVIVRGTSYGHAFHLVGYNNANEIINHDGLSIPPQSFICKNSYNKTPYFYLRYEDFDLLFFTKIAFENNLKNILYYKKHIMNKLTLKSAKMAVELGLTNGERPNDSITREEAMALVFRVVEKVVDGEITKEDIVKASDKIDNYINKED